MCHHIDYIKKYDGCIAPLKHVVLKRRYNKCNIANTIKYLYKDSKLAKGQNDKEIQLRISKRNRSCLRYLS